MKKKAVSIVISIFVFVAIALVYVKRAKSVEAERNLPAKAQESARVKTMTVELGEVKEYLFASGTIRAVNRHLLYFENKGRVISILKSGENSLKEGDRVKKGDVLAELDTRDLVQEINSINASLEQLIALDKQNQADVITYRKLVADDALPREKLDQKQLEASKSYADLKAAKANLVKAKLLLEKSEIKSPCDGTIAYLNIKEGDYIAGAPNFSNEDDLLRSVPFVILEDEEMELTVDIPSGYAAKVKVGQKAMLYPFVVPPTVEQKIVNIKDDALAKKISHIGELIEAEVYSISPSVDPASRSIQVKIRTSKANKFRDGSSLSCQIITAFDDKHPVIPFNALFFENRQPYCFIVDGDKARRVDIKEFGVITSEKASIIEGLKAGDKLVIEGKHNLVDKSLVIEVD